MGDWIAFRLSNGQSRRLGTRDWVVDESDATQLRKEDAERKKREKMEKAKKR